jgi:hypothetical protein
MEQQLTFRMDEGKQIKTGKYTGFSKYKKLA